NKRRNGHGSNIRNCACRGIQPQQKRFVRSRGNTLFLFTDGLTEALDAKGEEFGIDRLETALTGARELTASQLVGKVLAEVTAFAKGTEQFDDITCLALRMPP